MKKIRLHGMAPDNGGNHHQAGSVLTVDDDGGPGCITAARADQLVKIHSATAVVEKEPAKASEA